MTVFWLILRNLWRNPLRTILTSMGTMVLVLAVTLIWSILHFLNQATSEKAANLKLVVTERWQLPSQMPFSYATALTRGGARDDRPGDIQPLDSMTWQFYGGSVSKTDRDIKSLAFFFAMQPEKIVTMMDELDELPAERTKELREAIEKMKSNKRAVLLGRDRLAALNKQVGDRFTLYGLNFRGIDLEVEVVGTMPFGTRYDNSGFMNREYLNDAIDAYNRESKTGKHPLTMKSLNLVWLRVRNRDEFQKIADQIATSPEFTSPAVKCETASSGISTFLDSYRDLLWGLRWLMAPSMLVTLSLVVANAISISVRERRNEIAVMKVLGFRPTQVMFLILGEALLVGFVAGLVSTTATYLLINVYLGGLKFPIAFFSAFFIPAESFLWGPSIGALTALAGAYFPSWNARSVKVAEVFSKVT